MGLEDWNNTFGVLSGDNATWMLHSLHLITIGPTVQPENFQELWKHEKSQRPWFTGEIVKP